MQTIYVWKRRFGAMNPDDAKRLKSLEVENGKLKKMLIQIFLHREGHPMSADRAQRHVLSTRTARPS